MNNRFFISISILVLFCSSCKKQQMICDVKTLFGSKIEIPENMSVRILGKDTLLSVKQNEYARMIIWYDSIQCASCNMNHIYNWNEVFEYSRDSVRGFNPIIIFSPNKRNLFDFEESLKVTKFKYPIFVDYNNIFVNINPQISTSNVLHVFLLDKNNKIVLVGSPFYSKPMFDLYKKTINELIANRGVLPEEKEKNRKL